MLYYFKSAWNKRNTVLLCLFLSSLSAFCQANEKKIRIGVANFPPYSIVENGVISGVEVDIIKESLHAMGYEVEFASYPYGRLPVSFRDKKIDATIVTMKNFDDLNVFYSDIVLREYQTVAVHLDSNNFSITKIKDLRNKSIRAHQRARLFYGEDFERISRTTQYQETAWQESQVKMLFTGRVDVIVLAHEIFIYFKDKLPQKITNKEYTVSKVFGEKFGFHNVFWNKVVRDDFNQGLAIIKQNKVFDKILTRYLAEYE